MNNLKNILFTTTLFVLINLVKYDEAIYYYKTHCNCVQVMRGFLMFLHYKRWRMDNVIE